MAIVMGVVVGMPIWALFGAGGAIGNQENKLQYRLPALFMQPASQPVRADLLGAVGSNRAKTGRNQRTTRPQRWRCAPVHGGRPPIRTPVPGTPRSGGPTCAADATKQPVETQLNQMVDRLRAMGACWMRLEKTRIVAPGQQYRFVCRMPLPNNPVYTKQFEANSENAATAVWQVTETIQRWLNAEAINK